MRSELVFGALAGVSNRFRLCKVATKATRRIHRPNTRMQDTINDVLIRFRRTNPETGAINHVTPSYPAEWCGNLTGVQEESLGRPVAAIRAGADPLSLAMRPGRAPLPAGEWIGF